MEPDSPTSDRSYSAKRPNFFIVGAAKAGTTSLHEYLSTVPGVYMSPYKEPHYFAPNVVSDNYYRKILVSEEYLKLFENVRNEIAIGESSPSYLWDKDSPMLLKDSCSHARIIIILRNPIDRAYSHYLATYRLGFETLDFYQAIKRDHSRKERNWKIPDIYVDQGLYHKQVKRFLDTFGNENVKILIFEEFIKHARETVKDVLKFLGVNSDVPIEVGRIHNPFSVPRTRFSPRIMRSLIILANKNKVNFDFTHKIIPAELLQNVVGSLLLRGSEKQEMTVEAHEFLRNIYRNDIDQLETTLCQSLPWKL